MEVSKRRAEALVGLRERTTLAMCGRVEDRVALQVALACAMREPVELVGFLLPQHQAKRVMTHRAELALTAAEWVDIFGKDAPPTREASVTTVVRSEDFRRELVRMSNALRCTVGEAEQSRSYARPWTQALCYIGLHFEDPDAAMEASLGSIVRADARRLEDLRAQIDEDGIDTMLMAKMLLSASEGVV